VDKEKATDVLYLDVCKAFDMVLHDILVSKLSKYSYNGWIVRGIRNLLNWRIQRVAVRG